MTMRQQRGRSSLTTMVSCFFLIAVCLLRTLVVVGFSPEPLFQSATTHTRSWLPPSCSFLSMVGDANGDYYGESSGSFMVKEFSDLDQLDEIVQLASQPIPERPDGIVVVVKYSSAQLTACQSTEAEYERLARANPASIFLRNMREYENADLLQSQVNVQTLPTHDIFYQGLRVRRIEGSNIAELDEAINQYQFQNSQLDLFSEEAKYKREQSWGESANSTPRTTNRFVPGYDWNKKGNAFDEVGGKAQQSFEDAFGDWLPNMDDE